MNIWDEAEILIVGSGFYGSTLAERIAGDMGKKVLMIDRRSHIGGNAYSSFDESSGIEVHRYGAHIFHTPNERVWRYLLGFTGFNSYRHRVFTVHRGGVYSLPVNMATICQFFGRVFSPDEARDLIASQSIEMGGQSPGNLEEKAISLIGRPLYEAFVRGYTAKQWQTDPRDLPAHIISRLPVRFSFDDAYFSDPYQGQPLAGYAAVFDAMLRSDLISVSLNTDYFEIKDHLPKDLPVIFTGPIDRYFEYSEGELGWRTVDFEYDRPSVDDFQGTAVMNYADEDVPFTRILEFKHFNPERSYPTGNTIVAREYSRFATRIDEPFYPIDAPADRVKYRRYSERAASLEGVHFGGRLGTYRYLDMHQAIGSALKDFENVIKPLLSR